ncbi:hypothetical protein [Chitinophaga hostae]|uniref:Uncharacterized protein n=1 Tax=Chitinophaga hostae TaxID=2831022 RepID=A0ABS5J8T3_9BACT|nr:hypothetical protein [Chitinophaga hostae]MBS0031621.1 hypothetical protein [Chitinophaga hostae]
METIIQGALCLAFLMILLLCRRIAKQTAYITQLESIQRLDTSSERGCACRETTVDILEVSVERPIDEHSRETAALKQELLAEMIQQLIRLDVLKVKYYVGKDEKGNILPLWESLVKATMHVCKS